METQDKNQDKTQTSSAPTGKLVIGLIAGLFAALLLAIGAVLWLLKNPAAPTAEPSTASPTAAAPAASIASAPTQPPVLADYPDSDLAFSALFGAQAEGKKTVKTRRDGLSTLWFEQAFTQGGQQYWVQFFTTQTLEKNGQPQDFHAASVSVSHITYRHDEMGWTMIDKEVDQFGTGTNGEAPTPTPVLLALNPSHTALLLDAHYMGQGYGYGYKTVVIFNGQTWQNAGDISTAGDNAGTCDDDVDSPPEPADSPLQPCYAWEGSVAIASDQPAGDLGLPALQVQRHSTLSAALEARRRQPDADSRKRIIYSYKNGEYRSPSDEQELGE